MKKLSIAGLIIGSLVLTTNLSYASAGACSGHDGVNCLAGHDVDGSVICNDGWNNSSVLYKNIVDVCAENYLPIGPFTDIVQKNKNREAVLFLEKEGIINGYDDGTFKPNNEINRAELLKILVEGVGITPKVEDYNNCFTDVKTEWYAPYACYAKSKGWIKGYDDGSFKPSRSVIKAEAIKMVINTQGIGISETVDSAPFEDVSVEQWYAPFVVKAKELGILEETESKYLPAQNITRGEVSENIFRAISFNRKKIENEAVDVESSVEDDDTITNSDDTTDVVDSENDVIENIKISGKRSTATDKFNLEDGLSIFTFDHKGDSNFIVKLLDKDGKYAGGIANQIGDANGKTVLNVNEGEYLMDIKADGSWNIEISQPRNIEPVADLSEFSGKNYDITDYFELKDGLSIFSFNYEGDSNFIVKLYNQYGVYEGVIANEIGDTTGKTALNVKEGVYFIGIQSEGDWDINFEEPREITGKELVNNLSSTGSFLSDFYNFKKGLVTINYEHHGDSNFIVKLLDEDGKYIEYIANEIGDTDGSTAFNISTDGIYFFDVMADGEWSLGIK